MALHKDGATAAKPRPYLPDSALRAAAESEPLGEEGEDEEGEREFEPDSDDDDDAAAATVDDDEAGAAAGSASTLRVSRASVSLSKAQRATDVLAAAQAGGMPRKQRLAG
jgi:hypothetical protein